MMLYLHGISLFSIKVCHIERNLTYKWKLQIAFVVWNGNQNFKFWVQLMVTKWHLMAWNYIYKSDLLWTLMKKTWSVAIVIIIKSQGKLDAILGILLEYLAVFPKDIKLAKLACSRAAKMPLVYVNSYNDGFYFGHLSTSDRHMMVTGCSWPGDTGHFTHAVSGNN